MHKLTAGTQARGSGVGVAHDLLGSREVVKDLGGDCVVHVVEKERRALADKVEAGEGTFVGKERPERLGLAHGSQKVNTQAKKPASHVLVVATQGQRERPARVGKVAPKVLPYRLRARERTVRA